MTDEKKPLARNGKKKTLTLNGKKLARLK